jgi:hypothetical protein
MGQDILSEEEKKMIKFEIIINKYKKKVSLKIEGKKK